MKTNKTKRTFFLGLICILLVAASSWYAVTYNDSRLVAPTDLSEYSFRMQDLPMLLSSTLLLVYILYLVTLVIRAVIAGKRREASAHTTRQIDPRFGLLGFFGFFGFLGFWTYSIDRTIFPFVFFMFFGFFGFFYEAKLSNTFMDERYRENRMKAHFTANRLSLAIIFLSTLFLGQGRLMSNLEYTLIAYIIIVSLALALEMFLGEFLLYRYDHDEFSDESEE